MNAKHAGGIVKESGKKEIRAWGCINRLARMSGPLVTACAADSEVADEEFDSQFDEV